ncbi:uncharacterized protein LOC124936475 isoform X2 [Impatiens glandulifera]|uniref:uncharacterized protein LOC124936475 isoform X2 n=1 Tax=Impatiens glandulifera TaxID=253017 RepID=UPI001FB08B2D|nr:uncharacterized protein LOC124936475 isoform X2 [Impatiens glandulifera]
MRNKKRNVAPRCKATPLLVVPGSGGSADDGVVSSTDAEQNLNPNSSIELRKPRNCKIESSLAESEASSYSVAKLECEKALTALRRGNYTKALRILKELCPRYENTSHSALIYRVQGTVCVKVASIINDINTKQRHLKNATESARKAVALSPNSIEFSHFYANLLYEIANDGKEYEEVVQECERGLALENPIDPAKESLQDESQQKQSTSDARITHVQSELRSLIQKSNIASISTWMKNLGTGEDKFRLIPIRRVSEDPMEVRLVSARRPNEIKKATKTPEERRKEIEVRVAAARLLQQKSESPQLQSDDSKGIVSSSVSTQRTGERRRSSMVRKNASSAERKDSVKSYWNSMGLDLKKDLLVVRISGLKAYFSAFKDTYGIDIISEAIAFAEANRTWKFWMCSRCNEKFSDPESHAQHVVQEHLGNLMPKMQSVIPANVDSEWIEMLLNCSWKPLDINAAAKMVDNCSTELVDESLPKIENLGHKDSMISNDYGLDDALISSPRIEKSGDSCNGKIDADDKIHGKFPGLVWRGSPGNKTFKAFPLSHNWTLSDDSERGKLLEKIFSLFQVLIKHKCLAGSHLTKIIQFAVDELQTLASGSLLLDYGIDQTPNCMCFLGASELKKVCKFLQDLSNSCGVGRYPENNNNVDDSSSHNQAAEILEKVTLSEDASCLHLNEYFLPCKQASVSSIDDAASHDNNWDNLVLLDDDALLSWIFTGPTSSEQLASWTHMKKDKVHQGMDILQTLEKEFYNLQRMCETKIEHLSYEEALQAVEDHCLEEGKRRERVKEFVQQSYEYILRKRREELMEFDNDMYMSTTRFEVEAISNIVKEAETLNGNQFGFEEPYTSATSHLCDLESGEDDNWRTKDYYHQTDSCIEVAIQRQKDQVSTEINKLDSRILRSVNGMQQFEVKLEPVSSHDYRSVLVPLVKSYLRAYLEDMAEKYATEKSDAAREAFLAELAEDSKKGSEGGGDNSKHIHEKIKDKKRNKEHRKTKDMKVAIVNGPILLPDDEIVEDNGFELEINNDLLKKEEEDFKRKIELEAEERKLEETLEYQRRIEDEAKQKHLAKQHMKLKTVVSGPLTGDDQSMIDPLSKQENGFPDDFVHTTINSVDKTMPRIGNSQSSLHMKDNQDRAVEVIDNNGSLLHTNAKQGLPNGDVLEAGLSHSDHPMKSDQRIGRRGRRHKSSAKLADTKFQELSSDKENIEVGLVRTMDSQRSDGDLPSMGDNARKTLRELKAEEDDEERFQADLKRAVRQSLDSSRMFQDTLSSKVEVTDDSSKNATTGDGEIDVFGTGLKNEVGEYNCFLNVIIQSMWHLRLFRDEFLRRSTSGHIHVGDPCVTCALYDIFLALSRASTEMKREAIAPTSLRTALSNLYPDSNFFQEAQMNDASEVLGVIFNCLHQSFKPANSQGNSNMESMERDCKGSWDCTNSGCMAHSLFGMDIFERMNCYNCGLESRHMKYTSFFHNINASALRTMKVMSAESSFDELLNLVEMNHQLACDPDVGGCGKLNHIHHILSSSPHIFITVLGWQNTCESIEDITATLSSLATEIDIGIPYRGLDPKNKHRLVSVVCYYGQHYHCFAYSHDHEQWVMYDDKTVKVIGGWGDVLIMCERGHLQPQVLFFEAVN